MDALPRAGLPVFCCRAAAPHFIICSTITFAEKNEWHIFILSVMRRVVKKIVLTFEGLGGNMKIKTKSISHKS